MDEILDTATTSASDPGSAPKAEVVDSATQADISRIDSEDVDEAFCSTYPDEPLDTEFKQKYPPDRFGEEVSANARVWKIYRVEATAADRAMLSGWNKTVDILLIFAGLFSAVSTAFIIESYKLLQVDHTEYIANALYLSLTTRNTTASIDLPPPGAAFEASRSSRWINGLWFLSLVLSLAAALLCILSKQWLEEYSLRTSAPAENQRHWARRHAFFNRALEQWHVSTVVSLMPVVLHISLFLFLAGLAVFLFHLEWIIMLCVLAFTASLVVFYVSSAILPLVYPACFLQTTSLRLLIHLYRLQRFDLLEGRDFDFIVRLIFWCQIYHFRERLALEADDISALVHNIERTFLRVRTCACKYTLRPCATPGSTPYVLRYISLRHRFVSPYASSWDTFQALLCLLKSHVSTTKVPDSYSLRWYPEFGHVFALALHALPRRTPPSDRPDIVTAYQYDPVVLLLDLCDILARMCIIRPENGSRDATEHPCTMWHVHSPCHGYCTDPLVLLRPSPSDEFGLIVGGDMPRRSTWRTLITMVETFGLLAGHSPLREPCLANISAHLGGVVDLLSAQLCEMHREGVDVSDMLAELFPSPSVLDIL
ncbi:hypothetical protein AURDEDRAFT_160364 [Auricularia subglabra TFB-10046 SS5]|nr:hypothetical protein AURDEDRAFT_160364 [Auricularia subglabra TFB-10046 SS5]